MNMTMVFTIFFHVEGQIIYPNEVQQEMKYSRKDIKAKLINVFLSYSLDIYIKYKQRFNI